MPPVESVATRSFSSEVKAASDDVPDTWGILLVDDEPTQRLIMARILKRAGYQVRTAANGKEALDQLADRQFQIVITDWEMPVMDGLSLCRKVRAAPDASHYVYIAMLSARDNVESVVTGLAAGADDYLTKPVIESELIARLSTAKRIIALQRALRIANERNRLLALRHPLSEIYNRLYLMEQLPREFRGAKRARRSLSVIVCDVDYLKQINDTHGHEAGSRVLVALGQYLSSQAEAVNGWAVHHGGDEFALVLPRKDPIAASELAEHIRFGLGESSLSLAYRCVPFTASFGVAGWYQKAPAKLGFEDLLRAADRAVFECKAAGRNRVVVHQL